MILVVAEAEVGRETVADPPRVVQKNGVRAEVGALALLGDWIPLNRRRAVSEKDGKDVVLGRPVAGQDRTRAEDAIVAARLVIVRLTNVVEVVVAEHQVVGAKARRRKKVRTLREHIVAVASLGCADA